MLSIADVQWVLHNVDPTGGELPLSVRRNGADRENRNLTLTLASDWRRAGDLSWRVTTWGLRRMAAGGLVLEALNDDERHERDLPADAMALRVKRAGQYGAHATARRTGFREGDIIIEFDERRDLMSEQDLLTYVVTSRKPGDTVPVTVLRGRQEVEYQLPIQP